MVSIGLIYCVPAVEIGIAYALGRCERTSSPELLARRLAHLAVASPSLFVLIGVACFLLHSPTSDSLVWWILWLTVLMAGGWAILRRATETPASSAATRAEPGVEAFYLTARPDDPNALVFYEVYKSQAAQDLHLQQEFTKTFLATLKSAQASDRVRTKLVEVAEQAEAPSN